MRGMSEVKDLILFPLELFNWIISSSIMAIVLIIIILAVKSLFRYKIGAKWHYMLWFILIARLLLPWSPETNISIFNLFSFDKQTEVIQTIDQSSLHNNDGIKIPVQKRTLIFNKDTSTAAKVVRNNITEVDSHLTFFKKFTFTYNTLFWIWAAGFLVMVIHTLHSAKGFDYKIKKKKIITQQDILDVFDHCKIKMDIWANIPLIETSSVKSPTLLGLIHPKLLLPKDIISTLDVNQLKFVFLHELAHYKRRDIAVNLFTSFLLMFHWFNPLIWYAFYRMREDQEVACDSEALFYVKPNELKEYALTIIRLLESFSKGHMVPGMASVSGTRHQVKRRIKMIKSYRETSFRWSVIGFVLIFMLCLTSLTNAKVGVLNNKAFASSTEGSMPIKQGVSSLLSGLSYNPGTRDEKAVADITLKYMNVVGNLDYRTMTGKEGFEYLIPTRQNYENSWIDNTLEQYKNNKLIYKVDDLDIDFVFVHSDEATACLTGKISRVGESADFPNVFRNNFRALFTLKKVNGKWLISTTPQNHSLAVMKFLPPGEESAIENIVYKYINYSHNRNYSNMTGKSGYEYLLTFVQGIEKGINNEQLNNIAEEKVKIYTENQWIDKVQNITLYISPVSDNTEQVNVKCMWNINRTGKTEELEDMYFEQNLTLLKYNGNWLVSNDEGLKY